MKVKRTYNTMRGMMRALGQDYVSAAKFFGDGIYCGYNQRTRTNIYAVPSPSLKKQIAFEFIKANWSKVEDWKVDALVRGEGDLSYFSCFYVGLYIKDGLNGEDVPYYGNSLSGEGYCHCKRMWTKSIKYLSAWRDRFVNVPRITIP